MALIQSAPFGVPPVRPGASPVRGADWLVLADTGPAAELSALAPSRSVRVTHEPAELRHLLQRSQPRVVVCAEPPASATDVAFVTAERVRRPTMRIVHLSAAVDVELRLAALRAGFDDALAVSITAAELIGRLAWQDALASAALPADGHLRFGDVLELDLAAHELRRHGHPVHLRPKEFGLLAALASTPGHVWTRGELLERVWGPTAGAGRGGRTVDVHVRWLRSKIEADPDRPVCLVTVRGTGYRLDGANRLDEPQR